MKLVQLTRDALLKPLQAVTGIVERRHTLPILSNVLIECSGERLAFIATDLELQITTWLDAKPEEAADYTVSARKLLDICRALPDETAVSLDYAKDVLKLQAGKTAFWLPL